LLSKIKRLPQIFSIGIITGFVIGGSFSFYYIINHNNYIQFNFYRTILSYFKDFLNQTILMFTILSLILCFYFIAALLIIFIGKKSESQKKIFATTSSLLFCFSAYGAVNTPLLDIFAKSMAPFTYSGIIFLSIINLRFLLNEKPSAKTSRNSIITAFSLIFFLIMLNTGLIIDKKINPPPGPNIILISVDSLRADHLSCYGYTRKTTPNIDSLASEAILYKNAISSAPWTSPAISSIFTSRHPTILGFATQNITILAEYLTLTEILRENNYLTKGIISNPQLSTATNINRGFNSYDESPIRLTVSSPKITEKAIAFIKKNKNNKFFLYLHYNDPHLIYELHESFNYYSRKYFGKINSKLSIRELRGLAKSFTKEDLEYLIACYDSEISFTDKYLGILFKKLKEMNLYNRSLIIFVADHGEEFCERGDHWIGHSKTLYQELIHVPLIIKLPEKTRAKILNERVGTIDLAPTILHYLGLSFPRHNQQNKNLIPFTNNDKTYNNLAISATTRRGFDLQSLTWNKWKLLCDLGKNSNKLFDLKNDPKETTNVAKENKAVYSKMLKILKDWNGDVLIQRVKAKVKRPNFSKDEIKKLRSLGYL